MTISHSPAPDTPAPAFHGEQVLLVPISRPQSDSDGAESTTIYVPAALAPAAVLAIVPNVAPNWRGLFRFHANAARDPARSPALRRWHADQCRRVKCHLAVPTPPAWSWRALCAAWGGFSQKPADIAVPDPAAGGSPLT